ncbi:MAG: phosphate acetyltransferase [Candidatus Woesearchaeota archaeon]|jgi:phosphate acetyltransferase
MKIFKFIKKEHKTKILDYIKTKAKTNPKRIVYPESEDERVLKAAAIVSYEKLAEVILIGNIEEIHKKEKELKINLNHVRIADPTAPQNAEKLEEFAQKLFELRKHKGLTIEQARELLKKPEYYGTMMVYTGEADGMVSGANHTTADTLRPALQIIKTKDDVKFASSFFMMVKEDSVFFFADCAFIEDPTVEQLITIAEQTADSAKRFGYIPKIAMLSFSTKGSGNSLSVEKVRKATEELKIKRPDLIIDGELQLDSAIVPDVAKKKCPNSPIKGEANVLIFPDLNSGNIGYKLVERFGNTKAIGPIVQGLKKPINDLSRGCSVEDIVLTTEITVIEAQENQ